MFLYLWLEMVISLLLKLQRKFYDHVAKRGRVIGIGTVQTRGFQATVTVVFMFKDTLIPGSIPGFTSHAARREGEAPHQARRSSSAFSLDL